MTEYNGPNVYRVIDVHPAVEIELSGEEVEALINAVSYVRMQFRSAPQPEPDVLDDVVHRLHMARTAIRAKHYTVNGERKRYAE
jgi:hypothetical protein